MDHVVNDYHLMSIEKDVLEFDSFELSYSDRKILSSVYMKCEVGEIVGLLGRNGTGKSSLMKIVFGALRTEYKSIRINGRTLLENNRDIAYLPQHPLIPSYLSIRKAFQLFGISCDAIVKEHPYLSDFLDFKSDQLSGGYRKLIEVIMILNSSSKFCILDEPFSGLMPLHIENLSAVLVDSKKEKGIIITDHLHRYVTAISDRMYVLSNGKTYPIRHQDQLVALGYLNNHE